MAPIQNEILKPKYVDFDMHFKPSPVFVDANLGASGDILLKTDADAIKQSVSNILQTHRYERPFQHSIDGRTRTLQFESISISSSTRKPFDRKNKGKGSGVITGTSSLAFMHEASNAINRFEPRAAGSALKIEKSARGEPMVQIQFKTLDTVEDVSIIIQRDR